MKNKLKQLKIKDQKQVEALKDLKPKEKTETSEGKSNNQPRTKIIFKINKINKILKLYLAKEKV